VWRKDLILYTIGDIGVDGALYSAMEFHGKTIDGLDMDGRFTMANMAIEAGGKAGIFKVDQKTLDYIKNKAKRKYTVYEPDADAGYARVIEYDASAIEPQVAFPHLPSNTKPVSKVQDVKIDQSVIGSCTNGRLQDLRLAAAVLKGRKVNPRVPVSYYRFAELYLEALKEF
jgi:3-isopropylmalate/(R)-2-methylmalate dehydratase large subunit